MGSRGEAPGQWVGGRSSPGAANEKKLKIQECALLSEFIYPPPNFQNVNVWLQKLHDLSVVEKAQNKPIFATAKRPFVR